MIGCETNSFFPNCMKEMLTSVIILVNFQRTETIFFPLCISRAQHSAWHRYVTSMFSGWAEKPEVLLIFWRIETSVWTRIVGESLYCMGDPIQASTWKVHGQAYLKALWRRYDYSRAKFQKQELTKPMQGYNRKPFKFLNRMFSLKLYTNLQGKLQ